MPLPQATLRSAVPLDVPGEDLSDVDGLLGRLETVRQEGRAPGD